MSGSGGGGYMPPQRVFFDCQTSVITSSVSSINITVLDKHKIGNVLNIEIGSSNALVLEDGDGEILGAILHLNTSDIIECIKGGAEYEAEILDIKSPACRVLIRRR
jgi:hypothetical protein